MPDLAIDNMLADFGIAHSEFEPARAALFEWGVIQRRPDRVNIARSKCGQARDVLELVFLWHCNNGECRQAARDDIDDAGDAGLSLLLVRQSACEMCGGSPGARSLERMGAALDAAGRSRILVVGGTERKERELRQKSPAGVEWRFVDGKVAREDRYYQPHRDWADIIVIWQSTPLDHRVSAHFDGKGDARVITVRRRGVAALAGEVVRHLAAR